MKIGIVGSGPAAAYAALRLNEFGADVRVFATRPWLSRLQNYCTNSSHPEEMSQELLDQLQKAQIRFFQGEVKRIHKARLTRSQSLPGGRSRLSDMFRIVVSENPEEGVLKQVQDNPEVFNKLGEDVLKSLHEPVESFHDVDVVIACFDELFTQPGLTPSGAMALNESRVAREMITLSNLWDGHQTKGQMLVVGGDDEALTFCARHSDSIIHVGIEDEASSSQIWQQACELAANQWEEDKDTYQSKLHEWRALEDYMRAKVPCPSEPQARICYFENSAVVAVDRLIDRDGLFVTIEHENEEISTHSFSSIVNARRPIWRADIFTGLALPNGVPELVVTPDEPGFYALGVGNSVIWHPHASKQELEEIEEDLGKWFRPAGDE